MPEVFVISDLHLGHSNILTFEHEGKPLRPFQNVDEMHETIIHRWNKVVTPQDKVYVAGDVAMTRAGLELFARMNGRKRLVRGNHDKFRLNQYRKFFQEIWGVRQFDGVWITHVPMHPITVEQKRVKVNIHGHLHANKIDHPKYFNACVECVDYTPVAIDAILQTL